MNRWLLLGALWGLIFSVPAVADSAGMSEAEASASERVEQFHLALLEMAKLPTHAEREGFIATLIPATFDLRRIAAVSTGRTWRELDKKNQQLFVQVLGELIGATYADWFDTFNGQTFEVTEVLSTRSGVVVRTEPRAQDRVVRLDYVSRKNGVFNVVADGVSDLSLRRSDYAAILKPAGFAALLQNIRDKIALARKT